MPHLCCAESSALRDIMCHTFYVFVQSLVSVMPAVLFSPSQLSLAWYSHTFIKLFLLI